MTGVKEGTVTITVTSNSITNPETGEKISGSVDITVVKSIGTDFKLTIQLKNTDDDQVLKPEETLQLEAIITPTGAADLSDVEWFSENTDIATVDSSTGLVTAKKIGETRIKARIGDSETQEGIMIYVTNDEKVSEFEWSTEVRSSIKVGTTTSANPVTFGPENAKYDTVKYSIEDNSIADIDENTGVITAHKAGTTKITVEVTGTIGNNLYNVSSTISINVID